MTFSALKPDTVAHLTLNKTYTPLAIMVHTNYIPRIFAYGNFFVAKFDLIKKKLLQTI